MSFLNVSGRGQALRGVAGAMGEAGGWIAGRVQQRGSEQAVLGEIERLNAETVDDDPQTYAGKLLAVLGKHGLEPGDRFDSLVKLKLLSWRQRLEEERARAQEAQKAQEAQVAAEEDLSRRLGAARTLQGAGAPDWAWKSAVHRGGVDLKTGLGFVPQPGKPDYMTDAAGKPYLRTPEGLQPVPVPEGFETKSRDADTVSPDVEIGGATGAIIKKIMDDNPGMGFTKALQLYQAGFRQGIVLGPDGTAVPLPGYPAALGAVRYGEKSGEQRAVKDLAADIEREKVVGREAGEREASLDIVGRKVAAQESAGKNLMDAIARARNLAGAMTTGLVGAVTQIVPGTSGFDLARIVETIKANVGFDKLQQLRDLSPTGGALGPVSDFENRLLQATIASLEQSQSYEQFLYNLDRVEQQYKESMKRIRDAYNEDVRRYGRGRMPKIDGFTQSSGPPPFPGTVQGQRATDDATGVTWTWTGREWSK